MAVASAGPYAKLHLAPDRQPRQHPTTRFLQAGCPSCRPTNSVKALKAQTHDVGANSHRHDRHDTDKTVLLRLVWRCEVSRPDRPTSAFSVGVCRAAQALPVRPPDALRRRTHLSGGRAGSIHTARHDRDRTVLSCQAGGVNWALVSAGVAVASLGIPTKFITDVDSGPVGTGIGDRLRVGDR